MERLNKALELLGVEQAHPSHWRHVLLMAIQSFAFASGDEGLAQACEANMGAIRASNSGATDN